MKWGHDKFEEMTLQERNRDEVMIWLFALNVHLSLSLSLSYVFSLHHIRGELPRVTHEVGVKVEAWIMVMLEGTDLEHTIKITFRTMLLLKL